MVARRRRLPGAYLPKPAPPLGRVVRPDPLGDVLRRHAVLCADGTLEICLFCAGRSGKPKVVFDDRYEVDAAAIELERLRGAQGYIRAHRCRIWRGVYHLTGSFR